MINVQIETDQKLVKLKEKSIIKLVSVVMKSEDIKNAEILFIFTTDNVLMELKKKYFNQEHFTDVIAFRLNDYNEDKVEGEIYISVPQVSKNAKQYNQAFNKELSRTLKITLVWASPRRVYKALQKRTLKERRMVWRMKLVRMMQRSLKNFKDQKILSKRMI